MAIASSMCQSYGRQKTLIIQRQKYFQQLIEANTDELNEYTKQAPSSIDINQLMSIILEFLDKEQNKLRTELERRQHILEIDAQDHQLVENSIN